MAPVAAFPSLLYENEKKYRLYFCILVFSSTHCQINFFIPESNHFRLAMMEWIQPNLEKQSLHTRHLWNEERIFMKHCHVFVADLQATKCSMNLYWTLFVLDHSFMMKSWYNITQPRSWRTREADWKCWQLIIWFVNYAFSPQVCSQ